MADLYRLLGFDVDLLLYRHVRTAADRTGHQQLCICLYSHLVHQLDGVRYNAGNYFRGIR